VEVLMECGFAALEPESGRFPLFVVETLSGA
jgi:hypothetical protein